MITRDDIPKLAERLNGSCQSLDDVLSEDYGVEFKDAPPDLLNQLDELVAQCVTCGWWSEPSVVNDEQVCEECRDAA